MGRTQGGADSRKAGALLLVSGMEFILLVTIGEASYGGYSVHANTISDLGATTASTFWFDEPAIIAWGLLWLLGGYFMFRGGGSKKSLILGLLPGAGVLIVGAFPENVSIAMHSVGTVIAVVFGIMAVLLSLRKVAPPIRFIFATLGVVSLIGTVVEFGAYSSPFVSLTLGPGGWERVIVYPLLIWEMGFGSHLLARGQGYADAP